MILRVVLLLACIAGLVAADATVHIRASSTIIAPRATLGDIADIEADAEVRARLEAIVVAELPNLTPVPLDAHLVIGLATRAAAPAILHVDGSGQVSRRARVLPVEELAAAASATLPGARCSLVRASGALTVPAAEDLRVLAEPLDPMAVGDVPFRVRVLVDGTEAGRALIVLRVERDADVVIALRDLPRGTVLRAGDLRVEQQVVDRHNIGASVDPSELFGHQARRDIKAGEALSPQLVAVVPAVRAGTPVTAVWPGHGFSVELQATALADAKAGERLALRRAGDGAMLHGIAQPDGTVLVVR